MTKEELFKIAGVLRNLGEEASLCFDSAADRKQIAIRFAAVFCTTERGFERFIESALPDGDMKK